MAKRRTGWVQMGCRINGGLWKPNKEGCLVQTGKQTWDTFIKECAKKEFGLTGTLDEIRLLLSGMEPEKFALPGKKFKGEVDNEETK